MICCDLALNNRSTSPLFVRDFLFIHMEVSSVNIIIFISRSFKAIDLQTRGVGQMIV